MAKYGKDYKYHFEEISLHQHLESILGRLEADVGPYIDIVQKHAQEENVGIGNFAIVRMLTPLIETVATALEDTPQGVLQNLGIKHPFLYWSLFRDVFSHNDEFEYAYYTQREETHSINPALGISYPSSSDSHTVSDKGVVMLTVTKLYWDLVSFIKNTVENSEDKTIKIAVGIEYYPDKGDKEVQSIVEEMKKVTRKED